MTTDIGTAEFEVGVDADLLSGRWFSLVPIAPKHHGPLYEMALREENSFRWRYRGAIPPFPAFEQSLYAGVMCQFVVCPNDRPDAVAGLVVAYNASPQDGHCYVSALSHAQTSPGVIEAVLLFLRYLFRHWPLRKIYMEALEFNLPQYRSAIEMGFLQEEGHLRSHHFFDDRYWDMFLYSIGRADAEKFESQFEFLKPPT